MGRIGIRKSERSGLWVATVIGAPPWGGTLFRSFPTRAEAEAWAQHAATTGKAFQ